MIMLRELLTRMQSQATGCVAILLVDLRHGTVMESCGDVATADAAGLGPILRDLVEPEHVILPRIPAPSGGGVPRELVLLSDDCTYVCRRLADPPHHAVAAICRGTQALGLTVALLRSEIEPEARA